MLQDNLGLQLLGIKLGLLKMLKVIILIQVMKLVETTLALNLFLQEEVQEFFLLDKILTELLLLDIVLMTKKQELILQLLDMVLVIKLVVQIRFILVKTLEKQMHQVELLQQVMNLVEVILVMVEQILGTEQVIRILLVIGI